MKFIMPNERGCKNTEREQLHEILCYYPLGLF